MTRWGDSCRELFGLVDEDLIEGDLDDLAAFRESLHVDAVFVADDGDQFGSTLNTLAVKIHQLLEIGAADLVESPLSRIGFET